MNVTQWVPKNNIVRAFRVPERGEKPAQDIIDFVNEFNLNGDDEGIVVSTGTDEFTVAMPGEIIVVDHLKEPFILSEEEFLNLYNPLN